MPIYEYKCKKCDTVFDVLQKINSEPVKTCINCGSKVEKLISASSFQFKGSGWYVTDYRKKDPDKDKHKKAVSTDKGNNTKSDVKAKEKQKNVA